MVYILDTPKSLYRFVKNKLQTKGEHSNDDDTSRSCYFASAKNNNFEIDDRVVVIEHLNSHGAVWEKRATDEWPCQDPLR